MDREGFRNRLQQYKEAKGFDPLLKYWEWKLKYDSAPQPDNMPSQPQPDLPTVAPQPLDDRMHRWDNEHYVDPVNTVFDADRYRSWKEPALKTFGKRVKFTYRDFMKTADVKHMKFLQSIGRLGNTLKGASIFSEVVQNLFPSEETELIEDLRVKMDKQNKWLTGLEDIPKYGTGTSGVLDKNKVYNRVKGDLIGNIDYSIVDAIGQYLFNEDSTVDEYIKTIKSAKDKYSNYNQNELDSLVTDAHKKYLKYLRASKDRSKTSPEYKDYSEKFDASRANFIMTHEDAKDLYLGLPLRSNTVIQSKYKPSVGDTSQTYYTFTPLQHETAFQKPIVDAYNNMLQNKVFKVVDDGKFLGLSISTPEIENADSNVIDIPKQNRAVAKIPLFGSATVSTGVDPNKGQYVSVYDVWDYNTAIANKHGDNVGKYIGGTPFELYDRIYLDDYYGVNSLPNKGDYYGGYLPEIEVKPKKYDEGGEVLSEDGLQYNTDETKQWLRNWYAGRLLYGKEQSKPDIINQISMLDEYLYPQTYTYKMGLPWDNSVQIKFDDAKIDKIPIKVDDSAINDYYKKTGFEIGGYYHPLEGIVLPSNYDPYVLIHELSHIFNDSGKTWDSTYDALRNENGGIEYPVGLSSPEYWLSPAEVHSRLMLFRKMNNLNPLKKYTLEDIKLLRKTAKDNMLFFFDDEQLLNLLNNVASAEEKENHKYKSKHV